MYISSKKIGLDASNLGNLGKSLIALSKKLIFLHLNKKTIE